MDDVCAVCRHRKVPPTRSVCEMCVPGSPQSDREPRLYVNQKPDVYATPEHASNGIIRVKFGDVTLALTLTEASWLAANIKRVMRSVEIPDMEKQRLKPGDRVLVTDDQGNDFDYVVKAAPWQLGHGAWVIGLAGISGGYSLDRVIRLVEAAETT